jgi:four helix bundle protein
MVARTYRELVCWQLANDLKRRVYELTARPSVATDFDFCKQIRGSARGAPRTIAEGFGRFRPADFARYLEFARGSLIETQNHLDDALDAKHVASDEHTQLWNLADRALRATTKLHQYLQTCKRQPRGTPDPETPN